jgi:5'(3')-deoxyribonucleotidase
MDLWTMPDGKKIPVSLLSNEYVMELYDRMKPIAGISPAESEMMGKPEPDDPRWFIIEKEAKRRGLDNRKTIFVDMDGVLADNITTWLSKYNIEFDDSIRREDIVEWEIEKYVKCSRNKLFSYIKEPGFYENVNEIEHAFWGIHFLRAHGYKIKVVSAGYSNDKLKWLFDHHFIIDKNDFIIEENKHTVEGDCLIDDYYERNIVDFVATGRPAVLFSQPWNYRFDYSPRAKNWTEVVERIQELYGNREGLRQED